MSDFFEKFYDRLHQNSVNSPNKMDQLYCVMEVNFPLKTLNPGLLINDEKFSKIYYLKFLKSGVETETKDFEAIFQYVSGFYIYLNRQVDDTFLMKIIYKPESYQEIKLYINGLKKLK